MIAPTATEAQLSTWFIKVAHALGWNMTYHTHDSRRSNPGYPDWTLLHPRGDAIFVELKGHGGRLRPGQLEWLNAFRGSGIDSYLWYPKDATEIIERLRHPERIRPGRGPI